MMKRRKHPKDYNHVKNGWVGGNPRYQRRRRKPVSKDKTMKPLGRN